MVSQLSTDSNHNLFVLVGQNAVRFTLNPEDDKLESLTEEDSISDDGRSRLLNNADEEQKASQGTNTECGKVIT